MGRSADQKNHSRSWWNLAYSDITASCTARASYESSHDVRSLRTDKPLGPETELPSPEVMIGPRSVTAQELGPISNAPIARQVRIVRPIRPVKASTAIVLVGAALHCFGVPTNSGPPEVFIANKGSFH
jgi:hypothetical protein